MAGQWASGARTGGAGPRAASNAEQRDSGARWKKEGGGRGADGWGRSVSGGADERGAGEQRRPMGPGVQGESGAQAGALCGRAAHCGCQVGQGRSGSTRQAVGEASATRRVQAGLRHASRAEREGRAG